MSAGGGEGWEQPGTHTLHTSVQSVIMTLCVCVCVCVCEREREREREREKTNSLLPRVVNKHASAFFHSALAQRGANLLRIHTANTILHSLRTCTWS